MEKLQFKKEIDAAFCVAYANLGAEKNLLKRRLEFFTKEFGTPINEMFHSANRMTLHTKEFGTPINEMFHSANRMTLQTDAKDYDPCALDKTRNFVHTLSIGWIFKRQKMYDHIKDSIDRQFDEED
jgi:hypothetical protein